MNRKTKARMPCIDTIQSCSLCSLVTQYKSTNTHTHTCRHTHKAKTSTKRTDKVIKSIQDQVHD